MLSRFDIVTVGGATEDIFLTVDDYEILDNRKDLARQKLLAFEYGGKVGVTDLARHFGGGAANVAVGCSRFGLRTACIGAVGNDDRGHAIKHNLLAHKVNGKFLKTVSGAHSGVSFIVLTPAREHVVLTHRGANSKLELTRDELKTIGRSRWTYLTSLSGNWKSVVKEVFGAAGMIVWNPGRLQLKAGYAALSSYLKKTTVLILNKDEAIELIMSHRKFSHAGSAQLSSVRSLVKIISGFGPHLVIITDGAKGAAAFDGTRFYARPAVKPKRVVDTTGVGDAFGSGFISGLHTYDGDVEKALELAAKNSASVVAQEGAQSGLLKR